MTGGKKKALTPEQVEKIADYFFKNPKYGRGVRVPGITGGSIVKPGDMLKTTDGMRFVIVADFSGIVYLHTKTGKVYSATITEVQGAMVGVFYDEVYKRTKHLIPIIEAYMGFIMGVASAVSGTAFIVIMTVNVLEFSHTHQKDFPKWYKAYKVLMKTRHVMIKHAPNLYNLVPDRKARPAAAPRTH